MNRTVKTATALAAAAGLMLGGEAAATAAPAAHQHGLNKTDVRFLKSNEQVNLAEITLGKIVLDRSHNKHARMLARVTIRDHDAAMQANEKVAKKDGVTLPDQPNKQQQAAAAELSKTNKVALTYFKLQVAGHKTSIRQTKHEIADGRRANVRKYARYYLPVAEKHLRMSERDLARYRANH